MNRPENTDDEEWQKALEARKKLAEMQMKEHDKEANNAKRHKTNTGAHKRR